MDEMTNVENLVENVETEVETTVQAEEISPEAQVIAEEYREQIDNLTTEIAELRKALSEMFTQSQGAPVSEPEAYVNSPDSITSRILKSHGIKEE